MPEVHVEVRGQLVELFLVSNMWDRTQVNRLGNKSSFLPTEQLTGPRAVFCVLSQRSAKAELTHKADGKVDLTAWATGLQVLLPSEPTYQDYFRKDSVALISLISAVWSGISLSDVYRKSKKLAPAGHHFGLPPSPQITPGWVQGSPFIWYPSTHHCRPSPTWDTRQFCYPLSAHLFQKELLPGSLEGTLSLLSSILRGPDPTRPKMLHYFHEFSYFTLTMYL